MNLCNYLEFTEIYILKSHKLRTCSFKWYLNVYIFVENIFDISIQNITLLQIQVEISIFKNTYFNKESVI